MADERGWQRFRRPETVPKGKAPVGKDTSIGFKATEEEEHDVSRPAPETDAKSRGSRILGGGTAQQNRPAKPSKLHIFGNEREEKQDDARLDPYRKPRQQEQAPVEERPAASASRPVTGKRRPPEIAIPHADEIDEGDIPATVNLARSATGKQQPLPSWAEP